MARANTKVILALRETARNLGQSNAYQWGHMGACNCGFLAQQVTHLQKREIHQSAMVGHGDWSEQLRDYCPTSGLPMDEIISEMTRFGFDIEDLVHLERLSDPAVLATLPERSFYHNQKKDVIRYIVAWAQLLENKLADRINLEQLYLKEEILV